jgi:hypothetical protein
LLKIVVGAEGVVNLDGVMSGLYNNQHKMSWFLYRKKQCIICKYVLGSVGSTHSKHAINLLMGVISKFVYELGVERSCGLRLGRSEYLEVCSDHNVVNLLVGLKSGQMVAINRRAIYCGKDSRGVVR